MKFTEFLATARLRLTPAPVTVVPGLACAVWVSLGIAGVAFKIH